MSLFVSTFIRVKNPLTGALCLIICACSCGRQKNALPQSREVLILIVCEGADLFCVLYFTMHLTLHLERIYILIYIPNKLGL